MMIRLMCLLGLLTLAACGDRAPRGGGDILVIGDSILAWNGREGRAVGDVIEAQLGREVTDRAVSGAQFDNDSSVQTALGFDIRSQFPGGRWNWVVMNGGANDLVFDDCGCGDCRHVVDGLIGPDGQSGSIPAFVETVLTSADQVMWMGYYTSPGDGSFEGCGDDLQVLEQRIESFANQRDALHFIDGDRVMTDGDLSLLAKDRTHPSPKGSALLGTMLAKAIAVRSQSPE